MISRRSLLLSAALPAVSLQAQNRRPLLVISVDGLDHRYLRDRDKLGLKIPTLRRLIREGEWADGVVGIMPTVTWPSHTTLITGVPAREHGILSNRRPKSEGGEYYWSVDLLKVETLWHATRTAGLKSAAITWPVTVGAEIDYNLPEYFEKRNGGAMDLDSIEKKGTPGLVEEIAKACPSFPHEWMDDRSRALATIFLLKQKRPDLILVHLVDHDSEAHEMGPFTREAKGIVEYTDELLAQIVEAMPKNYVLAIVSDHGFELNSKAIDPSAKIREALPGAKFTLNPVLLTAEDEATAQAIRKVSPESREIPSAEIKRFLGPVKVAAFEPPLNATYGSGAIKEHGNHGYWPGRQDFRSTFLLWGNGIQAKKTLEMDMLSIAARFANILAVRL